MKRGETRQAEVVEVRTTDDGQHQAELVLCTYGKVDTYRTSWKPGVFTRSLAAQDNLLGCVWCHDETRPIGVLSNFRDSATDLRSTLTFLPFDEVPDARMAYAAMKAGSHRGVSFRFERQQDGPDPSNRSATQIIDADIHEGSVVLVGSVPGTGVVAGSVRSDNRLSSADVLARVPARVPEYRAAVVAMAGTPVDAAMTGQDALAAADTALDALVSILVDANVPDEVLALVMAADAFTDVAMDELGVADVDEEPAAVVEALRSRLVRQKPQEDDDEVLTRLDRIGRRSGFRAPVGKDYTGPYADPKHERYPIDKEHVVAAWSYINQQDNADKYPWDGVTLTEVKDRIKAAMKKFGHEVND